MSYRDLDGFVHTKKMIFTDENAVEFTVIENFLNISPRVKILTQAAVSKYMVHTNRGAVGTKFKLSHDNMTAVCSYAPLYAEGFREKFSFKHPRDWSFLNLCLGKKRMVSRFILSIIMIFSCMKKYEISVHGSTGNKKMDLVKIYIMKLQPWIKFKGFSRHKLLTTSRKILCWLRFKRIKMPLTQKICSYFIVKHFGSFKEMFGVYFEAKHLIMSHKVVLYEL